MIYAGTDEPVRLNNCLLQGGLNVMKYLNKLKNNNPMREILAQ
jgi:hypothetical protein